MNVWWCNQTGSWYRESEAGVVRSAVSVRPKYRKTVGDARKGDIVVHYRSGLGIVALSRALRDGRACGAAEPPPGYGRGWVVPTKYFLLSHPIPLDAVRKRLLALELPRNPIQSNGRVMQVYFIPFDVRGLAVLRRASRDQWPSWAENVVRTERRRDRRLEQVAARMESRGEFDARSEEDARERIWRAIAIRRGRGDFRADLLRAYGNRCAISGADAVEALEAAHILPYRGAHTDHVQNGLLLRSDLHVLFDRGLLSIDPRTLTVRIADELRDTCYGRFHGKKVRRPEVASDQPNAAALRRRLKRQATVDG